MGDSTRAQEGLVIILGEGWFPFFELSKLETSCLHVCAESRRQIGRMVRVTALTPRTLWTRADTTTTGRLSADSIEPDLGMLSMQALPRARMSQQNQTFQINASKMGARGYRGYGRDIRGLEDKFASDILRDSRVSCQQRGPGSDLSYRGMVQADTSVSAGRNTGVSSSPIVRAGSGSRVPFVRVYSVKWELDATAILSPGFQWPEGVKEIHFWPRFNASVKNMAFPQTLENLKFDFSFNQSLAHGQVQWPPALKRIFLGTKWNQPMHGARDSWPASLEELHFGCHFNQPLAGDAAGLPRGLRKIVLGVMFDQPLVGVEWPPRLEFLVFSHWFNQSLDGVVFPASLKEIDLGTFIFSTPRSLGRAYGFNRPIDRVSWPVSLQRLALNGPFNQPVEDVVWPDSIQCLSFGPEFNQPINRVTWPASLQKLYLGLSFNQRIDQVMWPVSLRQLFLGQNFNRSLEGMAWSACPQQLDLGYSFNRRIDKVLWPTALLRLTLGDSFNQPIEKVVWPASLEELRFGEKFNQPIEEVVWPASLEELRFGEKFNQPIEEIAWPGSLRRLIFPEASQFDHGVAGVSWPSRLEELRFGNRFNQPLEGSSLPESLRELRFGWCFAYSVQGVLPDGIRRLTFSKWYPMSHIKRLSWPLSLAVLEVGSFRFTSWESVLKRAPHPVF